MRTATERDVPRLAEIWRACFGDEDAYIGFFLQNRFVPENTPVLTLGGTVVSQLFLLPALLRADGREIPIDYLFAAATDPDHRGRGFMRRLLQKAENTTRAHGREAIALLPGSAGLYDYYAKCGYTQAFTRRVWLVSRTELCALARPAGNAADAAAEVRSILCGRNGVVWDDAAIRYALEEHRRFRGKYAASAGVFASVGEDAVSVLAAPVDLPRAFDLVLRLTDAPSLTLTLPPDSPYGTLQRGGMIRFLRETIPIENAYLSFPME